MQILRLSLALRHPLLASEALFAYNQIHIFSSLYFKDNLIVIEPLTNNNPEQQVGGAEA